MVRQKLDALRQLQAEKAKREQESRDRDYVRTIKDRGELPRIILDGPDKDAQRDRLLAELDDPEFHIERVVIDPKPIVEPPGAIWDNSKMRDVTPQAKAFVEDNVRRMEARTAAPTLPPPKGRDLSENHCVTAVRGEPVWYFFAVETRLLTLCSHCGVPVRKGEELYRETVATGENPDDVAIKLWQRWRGRPDDADDFDFDISIHYPNLRLPRGA
jgi:hypothetical protein